MARIAGINLPNNKRIVIGLTYVKGIGHTSAARILAQANIVPDAKVSTLTDEQVNLLREIIEKNYKVEGELRTEVMMNIKRLKEIGSYRGTRHSKRLPVRGQRTKTNSRTVRGNVRHTMGSGKKPPAQKT